MSAVYMVAPDESTNDALKRLGFAHEWDGVSRIRCLRTGRTYVTTRCVWNTIAWIEAGCPDMGGANFYEGP